MALKNGIASKANPLARTCAALSIALLLAAALLAWPATAEADDAADVRAELGSKASELANLTQKLSESQEAVAGMDARIGELISEIDERQANRAVLQDRISSLATVMYKDGDGLNFLAIMTDSDSLSEMMERMELRNKVLTEYAELSEQQQRSQQELEVAYREISAEKDQQEARLADLLGQKEGLDAAVADLRGRESQLNEAEQQALAVAAEVSQQAADTVEAVAVPVPPAAAAGQPTAEGSASAEGEKAAEPEPSAEQQEPAAEEPAEPTPAAEEPAVSEGGWQTGIASAYGGSSDPSTPNPGSTATGAVCDDWSMGVAVPIAWGPGAYYGRAVEISYGGRTVVATVNDCGGMGGGARALDLQPGVFKALGASTCDEWGLREVQYRFL